MVALLILGTIMTLGVGALALRPTHANREWPESLAQLSPKLDGARLVQPLPDNARADLTLDPALQPLAEQLLVDADAARGAAVVMSVADGRILALAGRARLEKTNQPSLALEAWAPAASVFKLVTTAALLDKGVTPDTRVCYHGGVHSVEADNLERHPRLDRTCHDLSFGLARSQNAIVARLAAQHLNPQSLMEMARAFGFGSAPDAQFPAAPSLVNLPVEPLAFARVAAGFWKTTLSPLHGALIAAMIARGGSPVTARLVERVVAGDGHALAPVVDPIEELGQIVPRQAIAPEVARTLGAMMVNTTEWGTASAAFHEGRGRRCKRTLDWHVAGKTGSLYGDKPFVAYSWFVGFAPAEKPEIAFAVLLGHDHEGRVKAAELAKKLVAGYEAGVPAGALVAKR
jgi:cell division protein FtsI/penicillin-binding protein 2